MHAWTLFAAGGLVLAAPASLAQEDSGVAPGSDVGSGRDRPLGYLSDPDIPPKNLNEALLGGRVRLDNRLRVEIADTTDLETSTAVLNRIRLGYETKALHGFTGYIEMENVSTPTRDDFFVPQTMQGPADHTPVLAPEGTELNRAFVRYYNEDIAGSGVDLDVKGGRQRIELDDERFVGNKAWRMFEQTYDAASVRTNLGMEGFEAYYAYVWGVQRFFGPDGDNWDSEAQLFNASYEHAPELRVTGFAYLLDFGEDAPLASSDTFGLRVSGTFEDEGEDGTTIRYIASYARQQDAGLNPVPFDDADYIFAEIEFEPNGWPALAFGYELLGSNSGDDIAFQTPLGTLHGRQGFADEFLTTPVSGLQDIYARLTTDLPLDIKGYAAYHYFLEDDGGDELGWEIDFSLSKQIDENWAVLIKGAHHEGQSGRPDTDRFWVQAELSF